MDIGGGLVVAIVVICIGLMKIFRGPVGEAVADRLRGESGRGRTDPAMVAEMESLKQRLAEVEERLDFAERLLSQGAHGDQLPGGAHR
jgi:hypothetical protein